MKRLALISLAIILIVMIIYITLSIKKNNIEDQGYIITEIGDSFHIYYDPQETSHGSYYLKEDDSDLNIEVRTSITSDDFTLLNNDNDLTVYLFDHTYFIYKSKNSSGFKEINNLSDNNLDQFIIPYLLCNFDVVKEFYSEFMVKYPDISKEILESFEKSDYTSLEKYNLTSSEFERKRIMDYIQRLYS